ncbi:MAG: hypothetical protein ABFD79_04495 [Phycisphaerales bacterium]
MSSIIIGLVTFVCVLGGAVSGMYLRNFLPDHHLKEDSKDAMKAGIAIVATLAGLVLGLLISSAKNSLDSTSSTFTQAGAKIIMLDRVLVFYGDQASSIRANLRDTVQVMIDRIGNKGKSKGPQKSRGMESILDQIRTLNPENASQQQLQNQALEIGNELLQSRWLVFEQTQITLPSTFLIILIFWLTILFISSGLFSPFNSTVIIVMVVCTLSVSSAIFLIDDMSRPFQGMIKVSNTPFIKALERIIK